MSIKTKLDILDQVDSRGLKLVKAFVILLMGMLVVGEFLASWFSGISFDLIDLFAFDRLSAPETATLDPLNDLASPSPGCLQVADDLQICDVESLHREAVE